VWHDPITNETLLAMWHAGGYGFKVGRLLFIRVWQMAVPK
jgi:hypothetical protein